MAKWEIKTSVTPHIRVLDEIGALEALLPEIGPMKGCVQNEHHHLDVWGHAVATLEICEGILEAAEARGSARRPFK